MTIKSRAFSLPLIIMALPALLLSGCAGAPALPPSMPTLPPALTLSSTPPNTPFPLSPVITLTFTPSLLPSPTSPPLFQIRHTPMTLMLHPGTAVFDPVAFLKGFIALLEENNIRVITYQDILEDPGITAREQGKLAIITIDDVFLQAPPNPSVEKMISLLLEAGYPAVLGVVTQGSVPNEETVGLLQRLGEGGWEIATHTDTHLNLGELEKSSPGLVSLQVGISQDKIENAIGVRPAALILPYGQNVYDMRLLGNVGIIWVVGIPGGNSYDTAQNIHYVGREGPDGSPLATFTVMMRRFNPEMQFP